MKSGVINVKGLRKIVYLKNRRYKTLISTTILNLNRKFITSSLILLILFTNCTQHKDDTVIDKYNQKALELIKQIISEQSECSCFVKPPDKTIIEISLEENPRYDIREYLKEKLNINSDTQLDSLSRLSRNFKLDEKTSGLSCNTIINRAELQKNIEEYGTNKGQEIAYEKCNYNILLLTKPIFNVDYTVAVIDVDIPYTCIKTPPQIYIFKKNKWVQKYGRE